MKYFILDGKNQQQGPFSIYELKDRGIRQETLVWAEGMTDWRPAWEVEELRRFLFATTPGSVPPPPPSRKGQSAPSQRASEPVEADSVPPETGGATAPSATRQLSAKQLTALWVIIDVVVALLLALAVTNPSRNDHRATIQQQLQQALTPSSGNGNDSTADDDFFASGLDMLGDLIANQIAGPILDEILEYHNYLFFSRTTVTFKGKATTTSWGVFGHVYTVDEETLTLFLDKHSPIFRQKPDKSNDDADSDAPDGLNADSDNLSLQSRQGAQKIVDGVSDIVKDQVKQNTDSATGSFISKTIDEVKTLLQ